MVKPITPNEVAKVKQNLIPDFVFEAFNELIAKDWNGTSSIVRQKDVIDLIERKPHGRWEDSWLNVEPVYREAGWVVFYDKPGYNEEYEPTFKFSEKK